MNKSVMLALCLMMSVSQGFAQQPGGGRGGGHGGGGGGTRPGRPTQPGQPPSQPPTPPTPPSQPPTPPSQPPTPPSQPSQPSRPPVQPSPPSQPAPPPSRPSQPSASTHPIYRSLNGQYHLLSPDVNEGPRAGFRNEGVAFNAFDAGPIALYRCLGGADHMISTTPSCEAAPYHAEGIIGYAMPSASGNLVALYRCTNGKEHLATIDANECRTYRMDGILGYVAR